MRPTITCGTAYITSLELDATIHDRIIGICNRRCLGSWADRMLQSVGGGRATSLTPTYLGQSLAHESMQLRPDHSQLTVDSSRVESTRGHLL